MVLTDVPAAGVATSSQSVKNAVTVKCNKER